MLTYEVLKNHAGILLCGDYRTLRTLQEVVHEVNEQSPVIVNKEGAFLGLAYDARKAYQRQRRVKEPSDQLNESGVRFGVEILWPVLLVQSRMLRVSLAYFDSTKRQQAIAYDLESVIEEALDVDFGPKSALIGAQWKRLDPTHPAIEEKLDSRGAQYCIWTKAERKVMLPGLLMSFDPMYAALYPHLIETGERGLVPPNALDALAGTEWQDPRW